MAQLVVFVVAAVALSLISTVAIAENDQELDQLGKCLPSNFKSDGSKEDTIKKIFAKRDCIREQQKNRIGKWFCYVTEMVGIQKNDDGTWVSGKIKPNVEKFVATISEIYPDQKRDDALTSFTCGREYGLTDGEYQSSHNTCLSNFKIRFSPQIAVLEWSEDTYNFIGPFEHFTLFGTNDFYLFTELDNAYVTRGRCEKIN